MRNRTPYSRCPKAAAAGMAGYSNEGAQFTQLGKMMGRLVRDNYGSRSQGFPTMRVTGQCSPKTFLHGRTQVPFRRITGSAALALAAIGNRQSQLASDVETVRKSEGWFSPQELYRVVKPTHIERPYRTCTPPGARVSRCSTSRNRPFLRVSCGHHEKNGKPKACLDWGFLEHFFFYGKAYGEGTSDGCFVRGSHKIMRTCAKNDSCSPRNPSPDRCTMADATVAPGGQAVERAAPLPAEGNPEDAAPPAEAAAGDKKKGRKGRRAKNLKEAVAALVPELTAEWTLAEGVPIDLDRVELDRTATMGQIKTLNPADVERVAENLAVNPPVTLHHVVLWQAAENGMCASSALLVSIFAWPGSCESFLYAQAQLMRTCAKKFPVSSRVRLESILFTHLFVIQRPVSQCCIERLKNSFAN